MVAVTDLTGVTYNPETGMYEVNETEEPSFYGGRNITLANSGADLTRIAGTSNIDFSQIGQDAADAFITSVVGEGGKTPTDYRTSLQAEIDNYVPGSYGAEYLTEIQEARAAAAAAEEEKEKEEPYKSEIKKLKLPNNVYEEISSGAKGLKESDYEDKKISFDGKGFDHYMSTDGDYKEIQPMLDAGMDKVDMKRWGKALGITNVNKTSEAEDIAKAYQQGYLPGNEPEVTGYQLTDKTKDLFGNKFTAKEYTELADQGVKDKEIEKFLEDYIKGGGKVGSEFSVKVPQINLPGFDFL